ncbi:leukocyte surface antigen CD53-like isoform X2 [Cynoglossus semilaevis]|uniref:leukocyte surface antigen CD53-like isoform X2 n=1 Tax=Cynoglossus semilaevis TaxID=244447 RepID=UPI000D62BACF|nr:leukocyte surface antigen CD53-like isoform X2 [Cynoglossus semilaevis]
MAQINTCIKRTFITFNVFLAVVGGLVILLTCLAQIYTSKQAGDKVEAHLFGFIFFYILGVCTLVLASLGAFGGHRERRGVLIAFLVCVVIGTVATFRFGLYFYSLQPEVVSALEDDYHKLLPLNTAAENVKEMMDTEQSELQCCGLFSYTDWQSDIPQSCECSPEEAAEEGLCVDVTNRQFMFMPERKTIYAKPCFPIIMNYFLLVVDIVCGITVTLAVLGVRFLL